MIADDGSTNAARSARKENLAGVHSGYNREANVGKRISSGFLSARSPCSYVFLGRSVKYGVITVVFVLIAVSLSGTPPDQQTNRVCLILSTADTEEANEIRSIVSVGLAHEMEKQGFSMIPEQTWRAKLTQEELSSLELLRGSDAVRSAEKIQADIALVGSIQVEGKNIVLRIRGYDVLTKSLFFNREEREYKDIGIYNKVCSLTRELIDTLLVWAESQSETVVPEGELDEPRPQEMMSPQVERVLEPEAPPSEAGILDEGEPVEGEMKTEPVVLEKRPDQKEVKVRITLLSNDEGAQVYLGPDQRLGTIENGKLVIEVPENAQFAIETKKPGYYVNREYFEVNDQSAEIRLRPLFKRTRFGFELFSTSSQYLGIGAGFRFYVVPDYIMFRADDYVYFSISLGGDDSPSAFHNDFRIQFGSYLFTLPSRRVRFGLATGIGIILSVLGKSNTQLENSTFYDIYWDMIDLWIDFNWHKGAVFIKVETKYALGLGVCLLEPGFLAKYGPQFTVGWLKKF